MIHGNAAIKGSFYGIAEPLIRLLSLMITAINFLNWLAVYIDDINNYFPNLNPEKFDVHQITGWVWK